MAMGQVNGRLVGRVPPWRLLGAGLAGTATGGLCLLAAVSSGAFGIAGVLASLFIVVASLGFVLPNASALALAGLPRTAGSASALLGVLQFAIGAAAAPLVGIAGARTAFPMAVVMASLGVSALGTFLVLCRGGGGSGTATAEVAP
jgi:DHA1 family bicyclomycin/chloramphenicol resistance-like MFS transporter